MTESEKAQLGQLYNANHDSQLLNRRTWAKNLCMDYNQLRWDEGVKRTALLQELLGICGEDAVIEQYLGDQSDDFRTMCDEANVDPFEALNMALSEHNKEVRRNPTQRSSRNTRRR